MAAELSKRRKQSKNDKEKAAAAKELDSAVNALNSGESEQQEPARDKLHKALSLFKN